MYCSCWPARLGHRDSRCCRSTPWQAMQAVDLVCPSSADPSAPSAAVRCAPHEHDGQTAFISNAPRVDGTLHIRPGMSEQTYRASASLKGAELYTSRRRSGGRDRRPPESPPSQSVAQWPSFPDSTLSSPAPGSRDSFPPDDRRRGRIRRPFECGQVQRPERHHRPHATWRAPARPRAARSSSISSRWTDGAATRRSAGLRLRQGARAHAGSTGRSC